MQEITLKANAKINLGLDVLRRREDGYHDLRMIMQTVGLHDRIRIRKTRAAGIRMKTNLSYLPANENNLVYKAAALLMEEFDIREGVFIQLEKRIPVAAGLAGGSSDAAAVFIGMNKLFSLGLSKQDLMERGVRLGADIPYCIMQGTALAEGIGEKLTRLPAPPAGYVVLAKPPIHVSTKFVYQNLHIDVDTVHPDIDAQIRALEAGSLADVASAMGNVLETVTMPAYPVIEKIRQTMLSGGALGARMSGSGPTVFGIFDSRETAERVYRKLKFSDMTGQVFLTGFTGERA